MKSKLKGYLTGNLLLKILALIIAFLIWLLVTNSQNPVTTRLYSSVPITIINQDSIADIGKVVEPEGNGMVTLKVTERSSVLNRLSRNAGDFYVEADLENINAMNTVPLTVTCSNPSVTWDEIQIQPSSLKVTLEDKVEQQFVVSVSASGSTAAGYEVGTTEISQGKNIYIAGPRSVMQIINQVVAPVNVSGMGADATLTSQLKIIDKNGSELTESQLSLLEFKDSSGAMIADRQVEVDITMWVVQTDIPVEVKITGTPADGYRVVRVETVPVTLSLAGTKEALDALGGKLTVDETVSVAGARENLSHEIDLTETLAKMPEVRLIADTEPTVLVNVQIERSGDVTFTIPLGSVDLKNRPEKMNLVFTPADVLTVVIRGGAEAEKALRQEDIQASVDLSPCAQEGSYEVPVEITLPEGFELVAPVTLMVTSQRQESESIPEEEAAR